MRPARGAVCRSSRRQDPAVERNDRRRNGAARRSGRGEAGRTLLFGRRKLRSMNSWMHNSAAIVRSDTPTLLIHPTDAASRGIADGDEVRVALRSTPRAGHGGGGQHRDRPGIGELSAWLGA
ncbi:molybdopterin dinucleotide binding domain-containing protein [Sphingomonas sp. MMS24-JH45]